MTIQTINIGQIANDGTGDDLRAAFDKVNDNFVDLNTRFPNAATGENLGPTGAGVFESSTNSKLSFKKIIGGDNISLSESLTGITISTPSSLTQLIVVSDTGSVTVQSGQTMSITGSAGIATSVTGQNLTITATAGILGADTSPQLNTTLNANNQNITNGGSITASAFYGPLEGLVYGIDVRALFGSTQEFDFGSIRETYENIMDWLVGHSDVDFGTYINPGVVSDVVDLGAIAT